MRGKGVHYDSGCMAQGKPLTSEVLVPAAVYADEPSSGRRSSFESLLLKLGLPLGLFTAALTLYLVTAAPSVYSFDAAEFALASATWGIPHATGYPLFVLLGRLAMTVLPFGDAAFRIEVLTALFAALTPVTIFLVLIELRVPVIPSVLAVSMFAVSFYQWSSAVVTKEHSLHDWLTAMVLLLLLKWQRSSRFEWLLLSCLVYGLSLTNHMSAALYGPAFLGFVLWRLRAGAEGVPVGLALGPGEACGRLTLTRTQLLALGGCAAVSLLPYLYLPLAYLSHPAFNIAGHYDANGAFQPVDLASANGLLWMVTGRQFAGLMFGTELSHLPAQVWDLVRWLWGNFLGIGVVLGVLGLPTLRARNRSLFRLVVALAGLHVVFFVTYAAADRDSMFVPLYMLWTLPLATGIEAVAKLLGMGAVGKMGYGLQAVAVLVVASVNYPLLNLSRDKRPEEWATNFLSRVPPGSIVLTRWAFSGPLRYEQLIGGMRPDVQVIDRFLISQADMARLVQTHASGRPVVADEVNVLQSADGLTGICASPLPGASVDLGMGPVTEQDRLPFSGYLLVRCELGSVGGAAGPAASTGQH